MNEAHFFQALSDETRLRIIHLLACEKELSVCMLFNALQRSQPRVSRHLAYLRESGIVQVRRQAQWVFYRLHDDLRPFNRAVLDQLAAGLAPREPYLSDLARLRDLRAQGRPCAA
ncbi:MAG TPA: metalloregulator ArsR/SmtB family transcription factor [Thermopetrobacter sp.]|nr:metalloregulator ArsR/SmtB family transcription factor [Thermopetrobacter sp.]